MKLALGPVQYYWPKDKLIRFYQDVVNMPVDIVYLGETVCARRHELREEDWLSIATILSEAGKDVILSTQVLLESGTHLQVMRQIAENTHYVSEANDMGAVSLMENKKPFVAGAHLNLYNPAALRVMADLGAFRWVMPLEMSHEHLERIMQSLPENIQTEVFVYGRLPLAFSARCFTARYHNLQKDSCGFKCLNYPDGLTVRTREQQAFLVFNGIQTQSAKVYNLILEMPLLQTMKVDVLRISPQSEHTADIVFLFREVMENKRSALEGLHQMKKIMLEQPCNGYWYGKPGMEWFERP